MGSHIINKPSVLSRDTRFKSNATISPSPDSYNHSSFADINRSVDRGHSFSHAPKLLNKSKTHLFPGPGSHQPLYNPDKKLSYTMRSKVKLIDDRPVHLFLSRKSVLDTTTSQDFKPSTNPIKRVQNISTQRIQSWVQPLDLSSNNSRRLVLVLSLVPIKTFRFENKERSKSTSKLFL